MALLKDSLMTDTHAPAASRATLRTWIFSITFIGLFLVLLYQLALIFRPFILPIGWAIIIARMTYPLYSRLRARLGQRETLAAAILTLSVIAIIILPAVSLGVVLVDQSLAAYEEVSSWIMEGGLATLLRNSAGYSIGGVSFQEWLGRLIVSRERIEQAILEGGKQISGFFVSHLAGMAADAVAFVLNFLVMLLTLFFLYRDGTAVYRRFYRAIPLDEGHKAKLLGRLTGTVTAVVQGSLLTAAAQGTAAGVGYWLLGVPFPAVFGALTALFALIPFGGTSLIWGPIVVYLFATAPIWKGVLLLGIGAGLIGLMDNVLHPFLVGSETKLPMILLFFSTVGGLAYFGLIGLILGPILLAIAMTAYEIYVEEFEEDRRLLAVPNDRPPAPILPSS
jgi:predicted PurR-regulated permease PerM